MTTKKTTNELEDEGRPLTKKELRELKKELRALDIEMFEAQFGPVEYSGIDYYEGWQEELIAANDLAGFRD